MQEHIPPCFPLRCELVFERILPATKSFQGGEKLILFQIGLFSWVEETHLGLQRKPSMLEAAGPSTLFPCEHWVNFWKEYLLKIIILNVEKGSVFSKEAYSAELKKHMNLSKENQLFQSRSI
jgi:hypothetical protein